MYEEKIAHFWDWFESNCRDWNSVMNDRTRIAEDFIGVVGPKLRRIEDGLMILAGPLPGGIGDVIFTADGDVRRFALIEDLVMSAPKIDGWNFLALKPPLINGESFAVRMDGMSFDGSNIGFFESADRQYPDEIILNLVYENFEEQLSEQIFSGVIIFVENLIGELHLATSIDQINVIGPNPAHPPVRPIAGIVEYLEERERLFVEKYDHVRMNTEDDQYAVGEAMTPTNMPLLIVSNSKLFRWEGKPSHPWLCILEFGFHPIQTTGMPDFETVELMDELEESLNRTLPDHEGYLNLGRITGDGNRAVFFACKEFRRPSREFANLQRENSGTLAVNFRIFKDKYWRSIAWIGGKDGS